MVLGSNGVAGSLPADTFHCGNSHIGVQDGLLLG